MPVKKKKVIKKKVIAKKAVVKQAKANKPVGVVTHFYTAIKVAIVKFKQPVKVGATLGFRGATTDFNQKVASMQFDHKPLTTAPKNKEVGMKVSKRVREGDEVFII